MNRLRLGDEFGDILPQRINPCLPELRNLILLCDCEAKQRKRPGDKCDENCAMASPSASTTAESD
jgi:hypothetical protein